MNQKTVLETKMGLNGTRLLPLLIAALGAALSMSGQPRPTQLSVIPPGSLPPELERKAATLGDRLSKPGNERIVATGTLSRNGAAAPAILTFELPGKVKLDLGHGEILGFDGVGSWHSTTQLTAGDLDLLEALAEDPM